MILILTQVLLLSLSFVLLSLSLSRHYSHVMGKRFRLPNKTKWLYKGTGYCLLIIALIFSIYGWGVTLGLVYFLGSIMLISFLLSLILSYKPHWLISIPIVLNFLFK